MEKNAGEKPPGPELVFGLVGALGVDLDLVEKLLNDELKAVGYTAVGIRLSKLLHRTKVWNGEEKEKLDAKIEQHQEVGNLFAKEMKRADALALLAINEIRKNRKEKGDPDRPQERRAYILRQLKRPGEVTKLREVYGDAFFLVAMYSPKQMRVEELGRRIAAAYHEPWMKDKHDHTATELINRDQVEVDQYGVEEFGQNVRDTFPLADAFLDVPNDQQPWRVQRQIERFIQLLFEYPFHTPTREEYVMFHAKAASVRSADLSRQVGA